MLVVALIVALPSLFLVLMAVGMARLSDRSDNVRDQEFRRLTLRLLARRIAARRGLDRRLLSLPVLIDRRRTERRLVERRSDPAACDVALGQLSLIPAQERDESGRSAVA